MAIIEQIQLNIEPMSPPFLNAVLTFNVRFSEAEVRLNLEYYIHAQLMERDSDRDHYTLWQNGPDAFTLQALKRGETDLADDLIRPFWRETLRPDERRLKPVRIERGFTLPDGQDGDFDRAPEAMEFFAIVQITSELSPATVFSNQVNMKLVGAGA